MEKLTMEKLVNYCKQYGFIFQGSEIYGGLANSWDYGPLGRELKERGISVTCVTPGWVKTEMLLSEYNGVKVKFPHLALPEKVALKAIKDAKKNKRYSVYSLYVKFMHLLSKLYSTRVLMNCWMFGIRKYIK